jgi:hypothetical protein
MFVICFVVASEALRSVLNAVYCCVINTFNVYCHDQYIHDIPGSYSACTTACNFNSSFIMTVFFFCMARQPYMGLGLLVFVEVSWPHTLDTPQSVGLIWTRDQLVAETSTWQHTTLTRDRHPCLGWIRTHDPNKRAAEDPRLRPHGHWDRPLWLYRILKINARFVLKYFTYYNVCCVFQGCPACRRTHRTVTQAWRKVGIGTIFNAF